ncbi:MAG: DUF4270 domain-containing protein [Paludibacteraceae bacterium]|nr:DUF4270 domain-containing protein [Paludibacteraceae bacterium]
MKITLKVCSLFLFAIVLFSCTDDSLDLKNSIQPTKDEITLAADTFHLKATDSLVASIPAKVSTDTFLLGSYTDALYGNTKAEILAQFNCPTGWTLPTNISSPTLELKLSYTAYQAKGDSTLKINVYRMTNTFNYSGSYSSNINSNDYASTELVGSTTKSKKSSTAESDTISIALDTTLRNELFDAVRNNSSVYANDTAFTNFFKGLYISVDGSSTAIFTLSQLNMSLSYSYKNSGGTAISQVETFPANKEVRQVNRIVHDGTKPTTAGEIFVSSPAGIEANVNIPISSIRDRFKIKVANGIAYLNSTTRKLSVNSAMLNLEVADTSTIDYPKYLLLIRKSAINSFFSTLSTPDGKSSVLAQYSSSTKSYSFSLKTYLANQLKDASVIGDDPMVLIPVMTTYDTSSNITGVKYDSKLHAVALKGPTSTSPLKLDIVVSGF